MSETLGLFRLQQIDSQTDRLRTQLRAVQDSLENDAALRQASEQAETAEQEAGQARRALREAEGEFQAQRIKIEQTEASLYSGSVRNPKELQDLQQDVAALKRHLATLEDRLLAAMEAGESREAESRSRAEALQQLRASRENENRSLREQKQALERELDTHQLERQAASSALSPQVLSEYERLRTDRRGVAVAVVKDNACAACGSSLTAAQVQLARSPAQMAHCPACGRILYAS